MHRRVVEIMYVTSLLTLTACNAQSEASPAAQRTDSTVVRAHIESVNRLWRDAYLSGTLADAAKSVFAEDAVRIGAGRDPVVGLTAIEERLRANPMQVDDATFELVELQTSGDLAFTREGYSVTIDGEVYSGRSFVLWRRQADGGWKIHRIMFD